MNMILGTQFTDNTLLNIAIVLFEIALFTGVYASPSIIIRFGAVCAPMEEAKAKKFTVIFGLAYLLLSALIIFHWNLSVLPLLFIVLWTPVSYGILVYEEGKKSGPIVELFAKYSEIAVYIIVGVITTAVAWGVFALLSLVLDSENPVLLTINTILNWCAGVLVAYPMNRMWVFHSDSTGKDAVKEFAGFVTSRVSTLVIEEVVMLLCVNVLHINQYVSKYAIASVLVIILNYVFAKVFVFKGEKKEE